MVASLPLPVCAVDGWDFEACAFGVVVSFAVSLLVVSENAGLRSAFTAIKTELGSYQILGLLASVSNH